MAPKQVVHIEIEVSPNKTSYFVGETFDPAGMVVRVYYSDLTINTTTLYSYTPNGPLSLSDSYITVSFFNKTANLPIFVTDKFTEQNIKSADLGNNPFYNLFDQSMRFITDTISINRDSYTLGFNLIYHSRMSKALSQVCLGLPDRFKTNYHQLIIVDGVDKNENEIYKYVDADGYLHSFYKVDSRLYYCNADRLYLFLGDQNSDYFAEIVDESNNKLLFNDNGQLYQIIDGKDNSNIKEISYTNNKISSISDLRVANTNIQYSYNNAGRLTTVTFIYQNQLIKSLVLNYDNNGFLININEVVSNIVSRTLYNFTYNSNSATHNRLDLIDDCLNHKAYRMHYSFANPYNDYLVDSFENGVLSSNNSFISKGSLTRVGYSYRLDYQKTVDEIKLINHNNKTFAFSIDKTAKATASFGNDVSNAYQTLYKESGIHLSITGDTGTSINTHELKSISSPLTVTLSSSAVQLLNDYVYFVLRFYLRLKSSSPKRVRATMVFDGLTICDSHPIDINVDQYNKYQLVEIPFSLITGPNIFGNAITISIKDENDNYVSVDIGDIYLDKKAKTTLFFHGGQYAFNQITSVQLFDNILQSEPTKTISVTGEDFFSIDDFLSSFKHRGNCFNLLYLFRYCWTTYPVYFNNGRDFEICHFRFKLFVDDTAVFDSFNPGNSDLGSSNTWFIKSVSPDDKTISQTYYRFVDNCFEIITRTYVENDSLSWQEEKRRYDAYNNQLLKITNSHFYNGSILSSETNYEYFTNGELKKVSQVSGNETIVLYETSQNQDGYILRKTSGLSSNDYVYEKYLQIVIMHNQVNDGVITNSNFRKALIYDDYNSFLTNVIYMHNNEVKGNNNAYIDFSNNELYLSLNNSLIYKVLSNDVNDTVSFKRFENNTYNTIVEQEQTDLFDSVTFYGQNNNNICITNNYDGYKKIFNQELNEQTKVTFNYESNIEHPSVARLTSTIDAYINKTTTHSYDGDGFKEVIAFDNCFSIVKKYDDSLIYSFSNEPIYRIRNSNYKIDAYIDDDILLTFSVKYNYDAYNRLTSRIRTLGDGFSDPYLCDTYSYSSNSYLPSSFSHVDVGENDSIVDQDFSYDYYGNISSIATDFYDNDPIHTLPFLSYTRSFVFDGFNRLTSETWAFSIFGTTTRSYSYNDDGRIAQFGDATLVYNSLGQLHSFGNIVFTYDNYGNRITKTNGNEVTNYTYTRGMLLSNVTFNNREISIVYDYLGRRYKKENFKEAITYFYDGNRLIGEDHVGKTYYDENNVQLVGPTYKLRFFYHSDGTLNGFRHIYQSNNETITKDYVYIINAFHEIVGFTCLTEDFIHGITPNIAACYTYDAWGNHKVYGKSALENTDPLFIGNINPFRFKGYYYDQDIGLYYLLSRYYDPSIGQFISPDDYHYLDINNLSGYNLYSYCENNPVMYEDPDGHSLLMALFAGIGALIVAASTIKVGAAVAEQISTNGWNMKNWDHNRIIGTALDSLVTIGALSIGISFGVLTNNAFIGAGMTSLLNNIVNRIYYNYFADSSSSITGDSYNNYQYLTRWDRLDFVRSLEGASDKYSFNAMRAFGEYTGHMIWNHFDPNNQSAQFATVYFYKWDDYWYINLGAIILGLLGF